MRLPTAASLLLAALLAAGCTPDFAPASEVTGLRVLAIRAEPPELAPASDGSAPARAALESLVVHPAFAADPGRRAVVLHLACTPSPGDPAATACTTLSALSDPSRLLPAADLSAACAAPGVGAAGAITFAGLEACGDAGCGPLTVLRDPANPASTVTLPAAAYELPAGFTLADLPAGDATRVLGLEVVALALTLDANPSDVAPRTAAADGCAALGAVLANFGEAWPARAHVASVKRIRVRGPEAPSAPNQNPAVSGMTLGGVPLPPPGGVPPTFAPGVEHTLLPTLPGDFAALRQPYVRCDAAGAPIEARLEDWTFSWFATAGELDAGRTQSPTEPEGFTTPPAGTARIWTVVRDSRGGTAWQAGEAAAGP